MVARWIVVLWASLSVAPLLKLVQTGLGGWTVALAALYGLGWFFLRRALAGDRSATELGAFASTVPAKILGAVGVVALQVIAVAFSGWHALFLLMASCAMFFALWARAKSAAAMVRTTESALLLGGTLCLLAGLGEVTFRLPFVVAKTGGSRPGTERWEKEHYDRLWEGNRLRLRSLHLDHPKPEGTRRLVVLGDSFTWGDKIARTQDTWPYVLEQALNRTGLRTEVINLAVAGYTTVNELEALRQLGWMLEPDLLIVQFYMNDTLPSGPGYFREADQWYFRLWPLLPEFDDVLDSHSYFYSFLNTRFRALQMRLRYSDGHVPLFADDFEGWMDCQVALREMGDEAKKLGAPLLVVIFPTLTPGSLDEKTYPYTAIHRKVLATLDRLGVPALDLRPVYAGLGRSGESWWALPSDRHPGVDAHRVAGEAVHRRLRELGWISSWSERRE